MKKFLTKSKVLTVAFVWALAAVVIPSNIASAQIQDGINDAKGDGVPTTLFGGEGSIFTTVVNILLFVIGAVSVVMLIIGGIRYTTSAGNSTSVTAAKNTILYAVIGLVIAFLAYAIVNWVLTAVTPT